MIGFSQALVVCLMTSVCLGAAPSGPSNLEAARCIETSDAGALANLSHGQKHVCSEYFRLRKVTIKDVSFLNGQADVAVSAEYEVIKPTHAFIARQCVMPEAPMPDSALKAGTTIQRKDRQLTMRRWSSGWKCSSGDASASGGSN